MKVFIAILVTLALVHCCWAVCNLRQEKMKLTKYDRSYICEDKEDMYPDPDTLDMAFDFRPDFYRFLHNVSTCIEDIHGGYTGSYSAPVATKSYHYKTCCTPNWIPTNKVWHLDHICHILKPQKLWEMKCGGVCDLGTYNFVKNYQCTPDAFVYKRALIYCTYMIPQMNIVTLKIPTACACKFVSCNSLKRKPRYISRLQSRLGISTL